VSRARTYQYGHVHRGGRARRRARVVQLVVALVILGVCTTVVLISQ
jgi:hypothetical protein